MKKPFFRLYVTNKKENYYWMCGGTLEQMAPQLMQNDMNRNDGQSVYAYVFAYLSKMDKPMSDSCVCEYAAPNGMYFKLVQGGEVEIEEEQKD